MLQANKLDRKAILDVAGHAGGGLANSNQGTDRRPLIACNAGPRGSWTARLAYGDTRRKVVAVLTMAQALTADAARPGHLNLVTGWRKSVP